jgi:two-component system CheB/CheR fusion protein
VFIYFEAATQAQVARAFRYGLREGGLLMLSPAETVPREGGDFVTTDQHHAIFAANGAAPGSRKAPTREAANAQRPAYSEGAGQEPAAQPADAMYGRPHQLPQVVVDAEHRLRHLYGDAGLYLTIPDGAPTGNLLQMARPELLGALREVLSACFRSGAPAHAGPVPHGKLDDQQVTLLHVSPELGMDGRVERALVTFFASTPVGDGGDTDDAPQPPDTGATTQENRDLRRRLGTAENDHAGLVERLREKNQELQSVNGEYRSTTEELQASQEELQSLNEELRTVNEELREKYDETREAHAHLNALISATEFGTVFVERDRTIRMMTPKISEVFNLEPRDVGRKLTSFTHALQDCDPLALLSEAEGADTPAERTARHRDGRWFLLRARTFRDDEPGEYGLDGLVLSVIDVTRLQEAEREVRARDERLHHILHAAELVAASYDHADDALTLAGAIPAVFWEDMPAQIDAESFLARVEPQNREEVRKTLFTGEGAGRVELEFRASIDGREPRLIAATGERIDQGAGAEVLLTFRNVSAFKRVEAENAAKSRFLAQMSHELRTPLNAISGMADTLRSVDALGEDKAKRDEYLDDILFSASHLTDLVSDLLDIARLENDAAANMADFDVQATLESVLKIMQPLAEDKGIDLHFQSDAPATTLHAHERGFRQVFVNLVNNAIKYCPAGTEVTLDFTVHANGTKAIVSVVDEGPGIPDKLLDRIGTAFIHVDDPDVRPPHPTEEPGLGLGLSIVDQILRAHNGEMRVNSVPGRGTNMKTIWPLARTDDHGRVR